MSISQDIKATLNAAGDAPVYACRAWVNFNGTGTVAIRASGNVSSITDNGVGDYTVNFSTAMPDANYSWAGSAHNTTGNAFFVATNITSTQTSSAVRFVTTTYTSTLIDPDICTISAFR